jgi:putative membrane protein
MMDFIVLLVVLSISIWLTAKLLPGADIDRFVTAIPVALVLSLFNIVLKPLLIILSIPITIITLGLFIFVINGLIIWWTSKLFEKFTIQSFGWAILFSFLLSIIQSVIDKLIYKHT